MDQKLQTLLEDARAQAKRTGQTRVGPLHAALALAARDAKAFESVFGDGASKRILPLVRRLPEPSDADSAEGFFSELSSADVRDVSEELATRFDWIEDALRDERPEQPAADPDREESAPPVLDEAEADDAAFPGRIAALVEFVEGDGDVVGREDLVTEMIALLARRRPATVLLSGPEGSGKTALLAALAHKIQSADYDGPLADSAVIRLRTERILADNPYQALDQCLDALIEGQVVAIDDLEAVAVLAAGGALMQALARIRAAVEDDRVPLILMIDSRYVGQLRAAHEELIDEIVEVPVPPLAGGDLDQVTDLWGDVLATHHGVEIASSERLLATAPPGRDETRSHPGLAVDRLDAAASRAALRDASKVSAEDFSLPEEAAPPDADALIASISGRVRGQDQAVKTVSERLALTRANLDLRPERPDGVFLFVGPTGVGKTELARAVAAAVHGDESNLIRLDMSEYAHSWAIARLMGPQPGYVGYTEPDGWLTTRVRRMPGAVILLDEIEKAHPDVWNAFLQVFDAGRLTDARGEVTDFSETIIAMTSNLGADQFGKVEIGFGASGSEGRAATDRVLENVKRSMPPELVNRIDELVVFHPLERSAIKEIAELEIDRTLQRLRARGYELVVDAPSVALIAESGYDPAYGARHLQRNIERLLLQPLAAQSERKLSAEVVDGGIAWSA